MSKSFICTLFVIFATSNAFPGRYRRQYNWGVSPYYENRQYYETQPQQWSSQYQNNQNYYSPYFYGYQHQQPTWQTSNQQQSSYQSSYNRPSWFGNDQGYATAPPEYNIGSSYGRPKYLATMQPKPTLSPVVLERSTFFVTQQPEVIKTSTNDKKHPTFLERLGVATLPVVSTSSEDEEREKALKSLEAIEQEFLPERSTEKSDLNEDKSEVVTESTTVPELSGAEKDVIASKEFFETSSTENSSTTDSSTDSSTSTSTMEVETTTEASSTTTTSTFSTTTTEVTSTTTTTTTVPPVTETEPSSTSPPTTTATIITTTTEEQPVTLLAFQETNEMVSSAFNNTQSPTDQDTSEQNLNETGEGSGAGTTIDGIGSTFASTGIVGFRSPPLPKRTDLTAKAGLEVVEWTDADNEVRKVLTQ